MAIYDCVTFAGEWECLEIRVRELDGLVDHHIVVEGDRTFTNQPKAGASFRRMMDISPKIIRAIVPLDGCETPWEREYKQRNAIMDHIKNASGDDLVMVSDCDEIPRRAAFERGLELAPIKEQVCFCLDQYYFRLNWRDPADVVGTARLLRKSKITEPQKLRSIRPRAHETALERSGWHFGWLGTPEQAKAKIESFAHQELNTPDIANVAFLETCHRLRMTAHNGRLLQKLPIDDSFPIAVRENHGRYAHLIDP